LIACISKESDRKMSIARHFTLSGNPPLWWASAYKFGTITLLAVVSEQRRNHCEQTNDLLSSMREDHVMGSH
jgi:hypothetical protein